MSAVALTGAGLRTAFGRGVQAYWDGLLAGRHAMRGPGVARLEAAGASAPVGLVPDDALPERDAADAGHAGPARAGGRQRRWLRSAIGDALDDAGLQRLPPDALLVLAGQAPHAPPPDGLAHPGDWEEFVAPDLDAEAWPELCDLAPDRRLLVTHACASVAFGVALAGSVVRAGLAPVAVVAGATVLNRYEYESMRVVRALAEAPARPFDQARAGISLGEGAGALVLEDAEVAAARGGHADVRVAGASCRVVAGKGAASDARAIGACLDRAVAEAGVTAIDYVHAHATGTPQGDAAELEALESFAARGGMRRVLCDSHKGAIGHLLHTSAAPGVVTAVQALRRGVVPGTPGLQDPLPSERVELPRGPMPAALRTAAVTSLGFGGNLSALVLTRTEADPRTRG